MGRIGRRTVGPIAAALMGVASCVHQKPQPQIGEGSPARVRPGITVLLEDSLSLIRGKRIALITNQTGVDAAGTLDIDLLNGVAARAAGVTLVKLFSPEHGIRGTEDRENLESGIDQRSGLAVHSLYTVTAIAPPDSLLRDIDALVFDLQDIGVRTWTYVGSMIYAMRAAARRQLPIVVLIARIRSPAITSTGRCSTPASRTPMSITRGDPQSRTHYTPSRYATE